MMETLKPCPFCGGEAYIVEDEPTEGFCFVECSQCTARAAITDRRHAVERWNRRSYEPPEGAVLVDALGEVEE